MSQFVQISNIDIKVDIAFITVAVHTNAILATATSMLVLQTSSWRN